MFNRTVTIFKQTADGCEKTLVNGVFFSDTRGLSLESKGTAEACSVKVVVPLENLPSGLKICEGDYLCKGEISADYADITSLIQSEAAFMVIACDLRDYGENPHLMITGR